MASDIVFHIRVSSVQDDTPLLTVDEARKAILAKCLDKKPGTQCEADLDLAGVLVTATRWE